MAAKQIWTLISNGEYIGQDKGQIFRIDADKLSIKNTIYPIVLETTVNLARTVRLCKLVEIEDEPTLAIPYRIAATINGSLIDSKALVKDSADRYPHSITENAIAELDRALEWLKEHQQKST